MKPLYKFLTLLLMSSINFVAWAQTDVDAITMGKNSFCTGFVYTNSSWTNYWEGTNKRDNPNLGKVSTQSVSYMGNYGITKKLNVIVSLPYVKTRASAGYMRGLDGVQDANLWAKYQLIKKNIGHGTFLLFTVGGLTIPTNKYVTDYLPLSIGLGSTNASLRIIADYQINNWFATTSLTHVLRSNIKLDRNSYYTTTLHNTNEVAMPNATQVNVRAGYRSPRLIAEAVFNNWTTLGGFDITKNNMPFPSNRMNATTAGVNFKYNLTKVEKVSVTGGTNYVLAGRNVGQSTTFYGGIFLLMDFTHSSKKTAVSTSK